MNTLEELRKHLGTMPPERWPYRENVNLSIAFLCGMIDQLVAEIAQLRLEHERLGSTITDSAPRGYK